MHIPTVTMNKIGSNKANNVYKLSYWHLLRHCVCTPMEAEWHKNTNTHKNTWMLQLSDLTGLGAGLVKI